jgi:hypothetical protein
MNSEQLLLSRWRDLPPDKQREVLDFTEFLAARLLSSSESAASLNLSDSSENDQAPALRRRQSVPALIEAVRRRYRELPDNVEWLDSTVLIRQDRDEQ